MDLQGYFESKIGFMTFKEASARIEDHMIVHRMRERNAVKITEALEIAVKLLAWAEKQPVIIFESDIADIINEYYNNGLRDGFRRAEKVYDIKGERYGRN